MKMMTYVAGAICAVASLQAYAAEPVKPAHKHAASVCTQVQDMAEATLQARKGGHNDRAGDKAKLGSKRNDPMFTYAIDVAYDSDINKTGIGKEAYDYCMLHKAGA
ncbi:hypothetical protein TKWG_14130 [Advenella kashmirensis WT001]|uniref:Uncharacterized protein n=1 Tax=Advenella kashmirensis (strain DSM 17095 / LMG 22695 / WT001) TaxID=1036672 RepID=I3UD16_ADVKW|nr:hypothetical protein [Advenella kashmirensis]AFK62904.1 hypothetical protein TKWG_14130 [Advenella kashmirensis WT001]